MDSAKLGRTLAGIGVAGLIGSFLWWAIFFARVNQALGKGSSFGEELRCLVSSDGFCGFVFMVASKFGAFTYQPMFFWISVALIVIGLVIVGSSGTGIPAPAVAGGGKISSGNPSYDIDKWNALVQLDPEIAAAAAELNPLGSGAVHELASKYLVLNDKQHLGAIVKQIAEKYSALAQTLAEGEKLDELGRNVVTVWRMPWGVIARMRDDTALVVRPSGAEVLPSLEEFHKRYPDQSGGWDEITDIEDKRRFYQEARLVLQEFNAR